MESTLNECFFCYNCRGDEMKLFKTYGLAYMVFTFLFMIGFNLTIYLLGVNFASEYGATNYEIEYVAAEVGGWGGNPEISVTWPSYFRYYDENERNFIWSSKLYYEYNEMNKFTSNLVETNAILGVITLTSGLIGTLLAYSKRYTLIGYLLMILIGFMQILHFGIMNLNIIYILLLSVVTFLLIYKSKFVDWNNGVIFGNKK